jgi:serine/threonine-protein kinase
MNPEAEETYRFLGLARALAGDWAGAERVLREALSLPAAAAYTASVLGWVLAHVGKRAETSQLLADLERRATEGYVSPVAFALLHLALGDHGKALDWAERAHAERRGWLAYLKVNPLLDPLRSDLRFQALVEKLGL